MNAINKQRVIQPFPQIQSNPRHKSVSVTSPFFNPFLVEHIQLQLAAIFEKSLVSG